MKTKYLSADELGVTPLTRKYLVYAAKTLPKLDAPYKIARNADGTFGFRMSTVLTDSESWDFNENTCGTAGCILGLMKYRAGLDGVSWNKINWFSDSYGVQRLFFPDGVNMYAVTNKIAAKVTERFLKSGKVSFPNRVRE